MTEPRVLKIHEETTSEGRLSPVCLRFEAELLTIVSEDSAFPLPAAALEAVMSRFGAPFDAQASISVVGALELGADCSLRHVRHLAGYDVIARDYLVYDRAGQESCCALATTITAALLHLGRAAAERAQPNTPSWLPDE